MIEFNCIISYNVRYENKKGFNRMNFFTKLIHKVIYGNDYELIYHPNRKTQDRLSLEAVAGAAGLALVQGTFQTSFLLKMGADIDQTSLLSSLVLVASLACIFGGVVFDRRKKRKGIIIAMLLLARLMLSSVVFIPTLIGAQVGNQFCIWLMIALILLATVITNIADIGYNSLLAAVIPQNVRGRVMAVRSTINGIFVPIVPIVGAYYLDSMKESVPAFMVLSSICAVLVTVEALLLASIHEPEYPIAPRKKRSPKEIFCLIKSQPGFLGFLLNNFIFYTFLYICGTFTVTYLKSSDYIGASTLIIETAGLMMKICMLLMYRWWGRFCDRIGSGRVYFITQVLFGLEMLCWFLLPPQWLPAAIFIPYLFQSASNSSSAIALFTRKFEFCPQENQGLFLGIYGAVTAFSYLIGPAVGRWLLHLFEQTMSAEMLADFWQIRMIYLIAAVLIFLQKAVELIIKKKFEV